MQTLNIHTNGNASCDSHDMHIHDFEGIGWASKFSDLGTLDICHAATSLCHIEVRHIAAPPTPHHRHCHRCHCGVASAAPPPLLHTVATTHHIHIVNWNFFVSLFRNMKY